MNSQMKFMIQKRNKIVKCKYCQGLGQVNEVGNGRTSLKAWIKCSSCNGIGSILKIETRKFEFINKDNLPLIINQWYRDE